MQANPRQRHKPASLTVQVMHAERQVLDRRRLVSDRASLLGQNIRRQLTSPAMLLMAGGVGFAAGFFTKRQAAAPRNTKRPPGSASTIYARALQLIVLARTVSRLFPSSTTAASAQAPAER